MRFLLGALLVILCIMPSRSKRNRMRAARSTARQQDAVALVAATMETVLFETLAVQTAASQQQEHL